MRLYIPEEHVFLVNKKLEKFGWDMVKDEEELHYTLLPLIKTGSSPFKYYYLQNFKGKNGKSGLSVNLNLTKVPYINGYANFNTREEMMEFFQETSKMEEVLKSLENLSIPYENWK
jgi:hypothetical protein